MRMIKSCVVAILTWEARAVLSRYKPNIIAVTGSVGKTTTKDALYAVLSRQLHVRKSQKSFNSDIGVPLTILGFENAWKNPFKWISNIVRGLRLILFRQPYPTWLVLEVGADRPGDIRKVAQWLAPDIAVITGVPAMPVHVEFFKSREHLMREKRALAEFLKPDGALIVNGDDKEMLALCSEFKDRMSTYGFDDGNSFVAVYDEIQYKDARPYGMKFRLDRAGHSRELLVHGALGRPRIYAALAACAVAELVHIPEEDVAQALARWEPPPGRMRILEGLRGSIVIDDTYNSSPAAALAALETLKTVQAKRKIALLGDMLELGKFSVDAHRELGIKAAETAQLLLTVGVRARGIGEAALDAGMPEASIREYEQFEAARAGEELKNELREGDVVLIKGSQSMRMEKAVYELMADPVHAAALLVRQEIEWTHR